MSEKKSINELLEELEKIKKEVEIKDIQIQDLENKVNKDRIEIENSIGLTNSLKKEILEHEIKEEERALKYNNIKRKLGPAYRAVLKIKKVLEK